jgi:uncharacterized protein
MKQATDSFGFLNKFSYGLVPLVFLAVIIPVLILIGFGVYSLFRSGYMLYFTGLLAFCALVGATAVWLIKKRTGNVVLDGVNETMVEPSTDWSDFDMKVWEETNNYIQEALEADSQWTDMVLHAKSTAIFVADKYHGHNSSKELAFSAIELLKMMEEVSRRYRMTLKEHVPYIEKINLSTLKTIYGHKGKIAPFKKIWNAYRVYRVFSPYGLMAEARGLIIGKLFDGVSVELQVRLKKAFLQEVSSVSIDLYSGRFKFDEHTQADTPEEDIQSMAPAPDPLRICMIGQISAGKSSIINAVLGNMKAEINRLPSTDRVTIYQCSFDALDTIHLVDLPGLDGNHRNDESIMREVGKSDMVLWVVKANQSSRALDVSFFDKINSFYSDPANRSRKKPVFIGLLSHIDRLTPLSEWLPPYNLDSPENPKAKTIKAALDYNQGLLKIDEWVALSVSEERQHYNVDGLISKLQSKFDSAFQTQLNRRRMKGEDGVMFSETCKRVKNAAHAIFKNITGK